jgi:hypothetical protein
MNKGLEYDMRELYTKILCKKWKVRYISVDSLRNVIWVRFLSPNGNSILLSVGFREQYWADNE